MDIFYRLLPDEQFKLYTIIELTKKKEINEKWLVGFIEKCTIKNTLIILLINIFEQLILKY